MPVIRSCLILGGCCAAFLTLASTAVAQHRRVGGDARPATPAERRLVGQHLVFGFVGTDVPPWLADKIRRGEAAGVVVYGGNITTRESLRTLIAKLQAIPRPRLY